MELINWAKNKLEGTKSFTTSMSSVLTICITVAFCICFVGYLFYPSNAAEFLSDAPNWISDIFNSLHIGEESNVSFDIGSFFNKISNIELPCLSIYIPGCPNPVFSINIVAGIIFIVLMMLSCFFAPISSFTSILVSVFGWIISFRIVDSYKYLVETGSTSWQASGSCFWILTLLYTILLFNGVIGFAGVLAKENDGKINAKEFCLCVIASAFIAFVLAIFLNFFNWLIMGLGWAGCIFIGMVLIVLIVVFLEIFDLVSSND